MNKDSKLFVTCDCEGEALALNIDEEENLPPILQISFWSRGYDWSGSSIWFKIRTFFHMLRYKHPYTDTIIIEDTQKIDAIIHYLKEAKNEIESYNNRNHPDGDERYEEG